MDTPWALLGIEPTRDASLIRRAYARQIKTMQAGLDADRFHRLRKARETALKAADPTPRPDLLGDHRDKTAPRGDADDGARVDLRRDEHRDVVEDQDAVDDAPRLRRVLEVAPLLETEDDWIEARELRAIMLASLAERTFDGSRFESAINQAAMLPWGPRRDLEAACIKALVDDWRNADGDLDPKRIARSTPLLVVADRAFGWGSDDSVLTEALSARDADMVGVILDEAEVRSRPRRLPAAMRMRRPDVFAYFAKCEVRRSLYDKTLKFGTMPWRIDPFALAAPHLWAYHHRLWRELVPVYLLMSLPSALLWLFVIQAVNNIWIFVGLSALFVAICFLSGLFADRVLFAAADRAVTRADARGLYDKGKRDAFLAERKPLPSPVFFLFLIFQIFFPYRILMETLARL